MNVRNRVLLSALNEEEKRYEENSNLYNGSSIKYGGTNDSPRSSNIQVGGMKSIIGTYSKEPSIEDGGDDCGDDIELQDVGVTPSEVTTIQLLENKLR